MKSVLRVYSGRLMAGPHHVLRVATTVLVNAVRRQFQDPVRQGGEEVPVVVLRDGDTLVVCEVKTRTSHEYGSPHEAVTPTKVERMGRLAAAWLQVHAATPTEVRLDLVAVVKPRRGPIEIDHVRGLG